jgi:hypothetical protein
MASRRRTLGRMQQCATSQSSSALSRTASFSRLAQPTTAAATILSRSSVSISALTRLGNGADFDKARTFDTLRETLSDQVPSARNRRSASRDWQAIAQLSCPSYHACRDAGP